MWCWIAVASAQSLDLAGLEEARRATVSAAIGALAHQKRVESIERLGGMMSRAVDAETLAEMRLRLADLHYQEGVAGDRAALSLAEALYAQILEETPGFVRADQALHYLASAQWTLGEADLAIASWTELVRTHPDSSYLPDAYVHLGEAAYAHGDWSAANKSYLKASSWGDGPLATYVVYRLGWTAHHLDEVDRAVSSLRAAVASVDPAVSAAAAADLRQLYPEALLQAPLAPNPAPLASNAAPAAATPGSAAPDCAAVERTKRQQIVDDLARAPAHQLEIVKCWALLDVPRANAELARLEHTYGPKSPWARGRTEEELRRAKEARTDGRRTVRAASAGADR